ncbi:MAG: hypothetical protein ABSB14_12800 [Candidatus Sulfotelmatobacter sp.]
MRINLQLKTLLLSIALCMASRLSAQSPSSTVYAESFRQGTGHVVEETFEARLNLQDATYRERIKDSRGADRYTFSIVPHIPPGDNKVTAWYVKLGDLRHTIYDNVLLSSPAPSDDPAGTTKGSLWQLDPSRFAFVPVGAVRLIKVESFYVVLQVKAYHFTPPDSPYLDSMTVSVDFRNTDPRQSDPRQADPPAK